MTIDEAVKQLNDFCKAFEDEDIKNHIIQKYGDLGNVKEDYKATKVILAEIERLKQENEQFKKEVENLKYKNLYLSETAIEEQKQLQQENEQLREALKKCSPYSYIDLNRYTHCYYCKAPHYTKHTDECEYIKLTGGET